jgi:hypothetical protein
MAVSPHPQPQHSGIVMFSAVMIVIVGVFNFIDAIAAISRSSYFVNNTLFAGLTAWGVVFLIIGAIEILVGFGIMRGNQTARWAGVVIVGINAIGQLMFIGAYPVWSVIIMTIDLIIIYALVAHDEAFKQHMTRS